MTVNFREIVVNLIEENGIKFDDIVNLENVQTIAEGTFAPKMNLTFEMVNGERKHITTTLTATFIQDLNVNGITFEGDVQDLNKFFKRKISLNVLLGDE